MEIFDGAKLVVTVWYESENPKEEINDKTVKIYILKPLRAASAHAKRVTFTPQRISIGERFSLIFNWPIPFKRSMCGRYIKAYSLSIQRGIE
tara:strand:+ start:329 stop:604 length:276 start_codon:yes stop_codon:yes gene_type:complete